ncbi:hypothetical protein Aph02nite_25880 [Actinoplanes philippinensis]|uniref:Anti-sigma regulatory factor (Ser/Thr protein kinase) n=1 Tax=Actinoplanes philippinensis TaxID=35752 RepID=A0A1I2G587_9ACTN|nr:ATP-binding protein [Actinoplanes philippinensis]GIE76638.1 hypothetical protein Aph02nite_25880 [Actinoplanes philippinensis]SFF12894.1 Anti-sigma regulatory factor (Ser/Thr protein kinase) [Actinoplanes philippinensis]
MSGPSEQATDGVATVAYGDAGDLPGVRALARARARAYGLAADQVDGLTIAVSELVTNTLQHTRAGGRLRIWGDGSSLYCDVIDGGPQRRLGAVMPEPTAERGRGLAIVERLCDEVTSLTDGGFTIIRLRMVRRG